MTICTQKPKKAVGKSREGRGVLGSRPHTCIQKHTYVCTHAHKHVYPTVAHRRRSHGIPRVTSLHLHSDVHIRVHINTCTQQLLKCSSPPSPGHMFKYMYIHYTHSHIHRHTVAAAHMYTLSHRHRGIHTCLPEHAHVSLNASPIRRSPVSVHTCILILSHTLGVSSTASTLAGIPTGPPSILLQDLKPCLPGSSREYLVIKSAKGTGNRRKFHRLTLTSGLPSTDTRQN